MVKNLIWIKRACPLCDSKKTPTNPESKATLPSEENTWEQAKDLFMDVRNDNILCSPYMCSGSELLYCSWHFTQEQLNTLYSEIPFVLGNIMATARKQ